MGTAEGPPLIRSVSSVSAEGASALVRAAAEAARGAGLSVAVAVVDAEGGILALLRMDGVALPVAEFALDKAYTAATMRKTTAAFSDRMSSAPSLTLGLSNRPRLLAWGGGLPVMRDGACVGGIGVSGARDHEDIDCARAALLATEFDSVT